MKDVISFPKIGDYDIVFSYFLKKVTNIDVIPSPKITKKTIELGEKNSPSEVCLPFKYTLGNLIESLDNGATILFQAGGGCRYRYYAEVQEKILRDLGYKFKFVKLVSKGKYDIIGTYNIFKELNTKLTFKNFIYRGLISALMINYMDKIDNYIRENIGFEKDKNSFINLKKEMLKDFYNNKGIINLYRNYRKYKKKFKKIKIIKNNPIKIGIIGELYTAMEKSSTYDLEKKLAKNNIEIKRFTNLSYLLWQKKFLIKKMLKKTKKYCKYTLGADALDNIYRTLYLSKNHYDGIIHTKPFGCTPEISAIPIIKKICREKNMPIIFFSFDTESEDGGIDTRLEAFFDLLKYRRKKNEKSISRN